jgi:type II secretory pathway component GspD/PulD (secretin)
MRRTLPWVVGILAAAALTSAARAERWVIGRYAVYTPKKTSLSQVFASPPTTVRVTLGQTTVAVPDGGSVTVAGYSEMFESRTEYGPPLLGKVPYLGRLFRNVGNGRQIRTRRVIVSVRVIDLREEEFRQTGMRSR